MSLLQNPWAVWGAWFTLFVFFRFVIPGMPIFVAASIVFFFELLLRKVEVAWLKHLIRAAIYTRIAAIVFLYCASHFAWPILESYQVDVFRAHGGFWTFAWDAAGYHLTGKEFFLAFTGAGPMPSLGPDSPFYVYMGIQYAFFGLSPLTITLLNTAYVGGMLLVASKLLSLKDPWSKLSLVLLAFWPSAFLWSTQLLKEPLVLFMIILCFYAFSRVCDYLNNWKLWKWVGILLFSLCFLTWIRAYVGWSLYVGFLAAALFTLHNLRWRKVVRIRMFVALGIFLIGLVWADQAILPELLKYKGKTGQTAMAPEYLDHLRHNIEKQTPENMAGESTSIGTVPALLKQIPKAFMTAWMAPTPWGEGSNSGILKLAKLEMWLLYGVLLLYLFHWSQIIRAGQLTPIGAGMLVFCLLLSVLLGLVMPNIGTLFRLRLQFFLPMLCFIRFQNN